ncbi:hypothetical protein CspHIS471_0209880 [Cutaneotrichosporon sp. HIS471]|nr:hypothetical protein CspHIS471_0209880 [Cutaneotrichosporon sp. HIS471]
MAISQPYLRLKKVLEDGGCRQKRVGASHHHWAGPRGEDFTVAAHGTNGMVTAAAIAEIMEILGRESCPPHWASARLRGRRSQEKKRKAAERATNSLPPPPRGQVARSSKAASSKGRKGEKTAEVPPPTRHPAPLPRSIGLRL